MKGKIYFIPGLGADERVFHHVQMPKENVKTINWLPPYKNETIQNYAGRIKEQIDDDEPVIIGVSFGGMIAVEINNQCSVQKVILISSARNSAEIPSLLTLAGKTGFIKLIPSFFFSWHNELINLLFGVKSKIDRQLLKNIIKETEPSFARWALSAMARWDYWGVSKNIISIHGDKDRLIPYKAADYKIENGGHFMIVDKGDEIGRLLTALIE